MIDPRCDVAARVVALSLTSPVYDLCCDFVDIDTALGMTRTCEDHGATMAHAVSRRIGLGHRATSVHKYVHAKSLHSTRSTLHSKEAEQTKR